MHLPAAAVPPPRFVGDLDSVYAANLFMPYLKHESTDEGVDT